MRTKAKVGDVVKIIALDDGAGQAIAYEEGYKIGDVFVVEEVDTNYMNDITVTQEGHYLYDHEFEIIKSK